MRSSPRYYRRSLGLFLALGFLPLFLYNVSYRWIGTWYLSRPELNRDYLASLPENNSLGCLTLRERRPELLIVGDSHSYAAWDFLRLEEKLGLRVGACTMGGLYAPTLPELVKVLERLETPPKALVLGTSPRMFWLGKNLSQQMAEHFELLDQAHGSAATSWRRLLIDGARGRPFPRRADEYLRRVEDARPRVEALDEASVASRLAVSGEAEAIVKWQRRLNEARSNPDNPKALASVCSYVRAHGVKLTVIHVPESPHLRALYSDEEWARYKRELAPLEACADKLVVENAEFYSLGNRHWVNRGLSREHDYSAWSGVTPISRDGEFDMDHMNAVGARVFSERAAELFAR